MVRAGEGLCLDNFETGFLGETFTKDDLGQGRSCNDNLNICAYVHCLVLAILTMTHLMMVIYDAGRNDDDGDGDCNDDGDGNDDDGDGDCNDDGDGNDGDDESKEGQYNPN